MRKLILIPVVTFILVFSLVVKAGVSTGILARSCDDSPRNVVLTKAR